MTLPEYIAIWAIWVASGATATLMIGTKNGIIDSSYIVNRLYTRVSPYILPFFYCHLGVFVFADYLFFKWLKNKKKSVNNLTS